MRHFFALLLSVVVLTACSISQNEQPYTVADNQEPFTYKVHLYKILPDGSEQETGLVIEKGFYSAGPMDLQIRLSPNAKKVLFNQWEDSITVLYVANIDGSEKKAVATRSAPEEGDELQVYSIEWIDDEHIQYSEGGIRPSTYPENEETDSVTFTYKVNINSLEKELIEESTTKSPEGTLPYINIGMPTFEYPLGWHIMSTSNSASVQPYTDSLEGIFGPNTVRGYRSTEINFDKPHDLGPYDRHVDVQIQDFILEPPLESPEAYLSKIEATWDLQGQKENYTSSSGLDFVTWFGPGPVYEGDMVLYITQYTDDEGHKHFVEISRIGSDDETIKSELMPIIDSLTF